MHRGTRGILFLAILCSGTACEKTADLKKTNVYEKDHIQFRYPGNWRVTQDSESDGVRDILVETPGSALVTISISSIYGAPDIKAYARQYSDGVRSNSPNLKIGASTFGEPEDVNGFRILHEQFASRIFGEEVPHRRVYSQKPFADRMIHIISQVPDDDADLVEAGFDQINTSLQYQ